MTWLIWAWCRWPNTWAAAEQITADHHRPDWRQIRKFSWCALQVEWGEQRGTDITKRRQRGQPKVGSCAGAQLWGDKSTHVAVWKSAAHVETLPKTQPTPPKKKQQPHNHELCFKQRFAETFTILCLGSRNNTMPFVSWRLPICKPVIWLNERGNSVPKQRFSRQTVTNTNSSKSYSYCKGTALEQRQLNVLSHNSSGNLSRR